MLKTIIFIVALFFALSMEVSAQLMAGGKPIDVPLLKSKTKGSDWVKMKAFIEPTVSNDWENESISKSVKFAHSFNVQLNTENSGAWFYTENRKVWQLKIQSDNAFSMGLIFSKYKLPEGASLYIFNENKSVVYGAFTNRNNKSFNKLAVYPFPGDKLIIQYEEPLNIENDVELELGRVNHDYVGILKNRWKRRPSGPCHLDVNCQDEIDIQDLQRSVIRIISDDELGTATLINNTAYDAKPLVVSAFHTFDKNENAEITLFDFNYESPFCTEIDGSDIQTISGSTALASFDSLDFMLVEMSEIPPAAYRPYYSGWDASGIVPNAAYCIHHPNGDVKKLSIDNDQCDSLSFQGAFIKNGHWKVLSWDQGTTEAGSSGAGLFAGNNYLYGTLSGGLASCDNDQYDAFARLDKMWDYKKTVDQSIKSWLDPLNENTKVLAGFNPYEEEVACEVISNFQVVDKLQTISVIDSSSDVFEIAEKYSTIASGTLIGVGVGIADYTANSDDAGLLIKLYAGELVPETELHVFRYSFEELTKDAINYFDFKIPISIAGNFFISLQTTSIEDEISFYKSDFRHAFEQSLFIKENSNWQQVADGDDDEVGASLLMQVNTCGVFLKEDYDTINDYGSTTQIYPNPASSYLSVEFFSSEGEKQIVLTDLLGKTHVNIAVNNTKYYEMNLSAINAGIYLVRIISDNNNVETQRITIVK